MKFFLSSIAFLLLLSGPVFSQDLSPGYYLAEDPRRSIPQLYTIYESGGKLEAMEDFEIWRFEKKSEGWHGKETEGRLEPITISPSTNGLTLTSEDGDFPFKKMSANDFWRRSVEIDLGPNYVKSRMALRFTAAKQAKWIVLVNGEVMVYDAVLMPEGVLDVKLPHDLKEHLRLDLNGTNLFVRASGTTVAGFAPPRLDRPPPFKERDQKRMDQLLPDRWQSPGEILQFIEHASTYQKAVEEGARIAEKISDFRRLQPHMQDGFAHGRQLPVYENGLELLKGVGFQEAAARQLASRWRFFDHRFNSMYDSQALGFFSANFPLAKMQPKDLQEVFDQTEGLILCSTIDSLSMHIRTPKHPAGMTKLLQPKSEQVQNANVLPTGL